MVAAGDRAAVVETTSHGLACRAGRRGRLRRGDPHQPVPRASRVPRHVRGVPGGQAEPVRAARRARPTKPDERPRLGVVNLDDPSADLFADATRAAGARLVTYGLERHADVRAKAIEEDAGGLRIGVRTPGWTDPVALRLAGRFNVHNALAAVALGVGWGLDPAAVRAGLEAGRRRARPDGAGRARPAVRGRRRLRPQPGGAGRRPRSPRVRSPTPAGGGLIAVFGSAGERDTEKRPMMGRVAGERCRLVVVTDEDPRGEDQRDDPGRDRGRGRGRRSAARA